MKKQIIKLIQRYKKEIEALKENRSFNSADKIQTVGVLREVVQDLENIIGETKWECIT